ncbi:MAG: DEAD/DEAH box helicase [Zestosphaera sp.]
MPEPRVVVGMHGSAAGLLNCELVEVLRELGLTTLTPVQEASIPSVLSGRHTLIVAPTGSGKTEAAVLPIFSRMVEEGAGVKPIAAVYVTPLRALNRDMLRRLEALGGRLGFKVAVRHGDTPSSARRLMVESPPHVLITTPETLAYLLVNEALRRYLRNVRWVVIDEFHELINSKRGTHLLADLERIARLAGRYQRIALSASIGDVNEVKEVLAPGRVVAEAVIPASRESEVKVITPADTTGGSLERHAVVDAVSNLLTKFRSVIIFTNTRDEAEWLGSMLGRRGIPVEVHHGSLSKGVREDVEMRLKEGLLKAVVSTSSLELGIDVGYVDAVIQVSSPRQAVKLLQRIGRSSHKVWLKAVGYVVVGRSVDDLTESLVLVRRASNYDLEESRVFKKPLDALAHLLVGLGLEGGFTVEEAQELLRRSYPYMELREEELLEVLNFLQELRYVKAGPDGRYVTTGRGRIYYLRTTMIVESPQYDVVDAVSGGHIGTLDEEFIALSAGEGSSIVLSGRVWRVLSVDDEAKKVYVEPGSGEEALIPSWSGENIPVDYRVAREVCALRRLLASGRGFENYLSFLEDPVALDHVRDVLNTHTGKGYPLPTDRDVVVEVCRDANVLAVVHACLGSRGNLGLAYLISYYLSKMLGVDPVVKSDPYRVYLLLPKEVDERVVASLIVEGLRVEDLSTGLRDSLLRSTLARYVARRVLVRLGVIPEDAPTQIIKTLVSRYMDNNVVRGEVLNEVMTRYVDTEVIKDFIEGVRSGTLSMRLVIGRMPSPLALEGLRVAGGYGRVEVEGLPKNVIADLLRKRLLEKRVRLYCLNCGNSWESVVKELPDRISCSRCGYSVVGVHFGSEDLSEVVRKAIKHGVKYEYVMGEDDKRRYEELAASARLVLGFGRKAVIALAARGVGPHNAVKALSANNEQEFYLTLYELERNFIRTRKYWD